MRGADSAAPEYTLDHLRRAAQRLGMESLADSAWAYIDRASASAIAKARSSSSSSSSAAAAQPTPRRPGRAAHAAD
eukprot:15479187-Alexandrium_andersonii.AAC.1